MSSGPLRQRSMFPLLILLAWATGCGVGDRESVVVSSTMSTVASSTIVSSTTTVLPTTPTAPNPAGEVPDDTPASTTLSLGEWVGSRHPLTGMPAPDGSSVRPALAVKIGNNDTNSLPQLGLEDADIVYEALIEAGKTRFLAVYHSKVPDLVGPVRSARSSDIDLIGNLNRPFFAYWGSNQGVEAEVADAVSRGTFVLQTTSEEGQGFFTRDPSRGSPPYDGVLEAADLMAFGTGSAPEAILPYGEPAGISVPSLGVRWETGARQVDYLWDREMSRWLRFQDSRPLLDGSGEQLAADNVLILYVDYDRSIADSTSPQALSTGGGDGWLFRDGTVTGVTWNRAFVADGWALADDDTAVPVRLDYGTTWVVLAQLGEASLLDLSTVASLQR